MKETVQTAVIGVTGYAGAELARLLLHHPRLKGKPPVFAGRVDAKDAARGGVPLGEIHPELVDSKGSGDLKQEPFSWELLKTRGAEVLFLATPHEQSREWVPEALERGLRVIDLSGAWRLTEAANRAVYAFEDDGTELADGDASRGCLWDAGVASQADSKALAGGESGMLRDLCDFAAEAAGGSGAGGVGARDCCRCQERRERRGQGADGEDAFYACRGQSFGLRRVYASAYRRIAGADRRRCKRDRFYAAPVADSARHSGNDIRALQRSRRRAPA